MQARNLLSNLRVASPCLARWSDMTGDDRTRFCGQCRKHVYNLSEMTAGEASDLLREREGTLCVRFYQRSDGTVMTADCPEGADRARRRTRRFAMAAAVGLFLGAGVATPAGTAGDGGGARGRSRLARTWNEAVWTVKGWFGIQRPQLLMGGACMAAPLTPPPPPPAR